MRILFVTSEVHPLVKTGGLADVSASLPRALQSLGHQVVITVPAYRDALAAARPFGIRVLATYEIDGHGVRLLETRLPGTRNRVWLVDCPAMFDRPGNPYHDASGRPWTDNAERFLLFCRAAALLAYDAFGTGWRPEVVHANDWQSAPTALLLHAKRPRPALVFTIHNLAYQGIFPYATFSRLGLPGRYWSPESLEFHGQLNLMKAGIVYADRITTVSPTYAREIRGEPSGCGLDGLLRHRGHVLSGIINGIDTRAWNPARDPALAATYSATSLDQKRLDKLALQAGFGLDADPDAPLLAFIGRLTEQKGIDELTAALPHLLQQGAQAVLLGSGDAQHESRLGDLALRFPGRIGLKLGYDEDAAHRIEGGADIFLMPSRFEPCGLNQMYSMRYGTVPVVHAVGGLADTVVDTTAETLADGSATGFSYAEPGAEGLIAAAQRALGLYRDRRTWRMLQLNGMRTDFSWRSSARLYEALYLQAMTELATREPAP